MLKNVKFTIIHKGGVVRCDSKRQHDRIVKYLLKWHTNEEVEKDAVGVQKRGLAL